MKRDGSAVTRPRWTVAGGGRRSVVLVLVALALLLAAGGAAVGCGSKGHPGAGSETPAVTYTNDEYGFSITYADTLSQVAPASASGNADGAALEVLFADAREAALPGRYTDVLRVSVYDLTREVKPHHARGIERELQASVNQMIAALTSGRVVKRLRPVTSHGVPGYALKYTYTQDGDRLIAVTLFLFKGEREYQVTAQAAAADWEDLKAELETALESFTVV